MLRMRFYLARLQLSSGVIPLHASMMQEVIVNIVVDPQFGERLEEIASRGPVWIAATPTNRAAAERWWNAHSPPAELEGVTTFLVEPGESPEDWCLQVLPTVDMHFGAYDDNAPLYDAAAVWGAKPVAALLELLAANGYTRVTSMPDGFLASRNVRAA